MIALGERPPERAELWARLNAAPRHLAAKLSRHDIPNQPGVYAWYCDNQPIYAGRAAGKHGLRERISKNHLGTSRDLSRSSFRRNVCDHLGIAPTSVTSARPAQLGADQVEPVNSWIRQCEVSWLVCDDADGARKLESALLSEWLPPLSRR